VIYNLLENVLAILIGVLVVGTAVIASLVGNWDDLLSHHRRDVPLRIPAVRHDDRHLVPRSWWVPIAFAGTVRECSRCGTRCICGTVAPAWARNIPQIRGMRHARRGRRDASRGFMFDTDNPDEMRKWRGWRALVPLTRCCCSGASRCSVTISFTVLAQSAARANPNVAALIESGDRAAALSAMSDAFAVGGRGRCSHHLSSDSSR